MSCCNDSKPKKVKEWGTVDKKTNFSSKKYILLVSLVIVGVIGFIVFW
jgi:hypothetical protein